MTKNRKLGNLRLLSMKFALSCTLISGCILSVGCGGDPITDEIVQVSGVVMSKGKPLENVKVTFMPDFEEGNQSTLSASGETNAEGRYELAFLVSGKQEFGVPVGAHRVVLHDLTQIESRTADGMPKPRRSRIDPKLTSASTTKLTASVESGDPVNIDFKFD